MKNKRKEKKENNSNQGILENRVTLDAAHWPDCSGNLFCRQIQKSLGDAFHMWSIFFRPFLYCVVRSLSTMSHTLNLLIYGKLAFQRRTKHNLQTKIQMEICEREK